MLFFPHRKISKPSYILNTEKISAQKFMSTHAKSLRVDRRHFSHAINFSIHCGSVFCDFSKSGFLSIIFDAEKSIELPLMYQINLRTIFKVRATSKLPIPCVCMALLRSILSRETSALRFKLATRYHAAQENLTKASGAKKMIWRTKVFPRRYVA